MKSIFTTTSILGGLLCMPAFSQSSTNVGFDGGSDGGFIGNAFFEAAGGNPDGNAHHFVTAFFLALRTGGIGEPVNADFLGDYSAADEVTFSFDVKTDLLTDFIGNDIAREIGISLIDRDIQGPSGSSGVFFTVGALSSSAQPNWTTLSVTIDDPTSATLPAGWVGFGDEDPNTFEPILPAGATFATVLASVDEFQISGAVPGFFFNNANFDVRIDNVAVEICEPMQMNYCSTTGGTLSASGSLGWTDNTFGLVANSIPNSTGLFFMGTTQASFPFGDGTMCVAGPIRRLARPVRAMSNTSAISLDFLNLNTNASLISPCSTWNFQYLYRVPQSFDLTDGLSVTFGS